MLWQSPVEEIWKSKERRSKKQSDILKSLIALFIHLNFLRCLHKLRLYTQPAILSYHGTFENQE